MCSLHVACYRSTAVKSPYPGMQYTPACISRDAFFSARCKPCLLEDSLVASSVLDHVIRRLCQCVLEGLPVDDPDLN